MSAESFVLPDDVRYDRHHQWARWEDPVWRCGVTAYQADLAGDMVFVGLPAAGSRVEAGAEIGSVESGKWVSSLFAPVSGTVVEVNQAVRDDPALVNRAPYGDGWIFALQPAEALQGMSVSEYARLIDEEQAADAPGIRERAR